jgi:hypothetical protein
MKNFQADLNLSLSINMAIRSQSQEEAAKVITEAAQKIINRLQQRQKGIEIKITNISLGKKLNITTN